MVTYYSHYSHKNCEESESLPYLEVSKFASYCFMDSGKRYMTPKSGTKKFITLHTTKSMSISVLASVCDPSPMEQMQMNLDGYLHT